MTTNPQYAKVSSCGGKATTSDRVTLPLTTPMPPNSTIMVENEPVYQAFVDQGWIFIEKDEVSCFNFHQCKTRKAYAPITADQQSEGEKEKATVPAGQQLQVMSLTKSNGWQWMTVPENLQDGALQECITKRLPHRLIPIPDKSRVNNYIVKEANNGIDGYNNDSAFNLLQPIPAKSASGETVEQAEIFETNLALGYNQLAYIVHYRNDDYLCIGLKNVSRSDTWVVGELVKIYKHETNTLVKSDFKLSDSPLCNLPFYAWQKKQSTQDHKRIVEVIEGEIINFEILINACINSASKQKYRYTRKVLTDLLTQIKNLK